MVDARALLEKHNPVLIILPNTADKKRPGAWLASGRRGDYHPMAAKPFLAHCARLDERRWQWIPGFLRPKQQPAGLEALREKVRASEATAIAAWELDLAHIPSANAVKAWKHYQAILDDEPGAAREVVYGRCVQAGDAVVLQYWYFYFYNDKQNRHEGDWEMVSIELDARTLEPRRVGYAGHEGGAQRDWPGIQKFEADPNRPLVFVAKGSHAAYMDYLEDGYRPTSISFRKEAESEAPPSLWTRWNTFLGRNVPFLRIKDVLPRPGPGPGDVGEPRDEIEVVPFPDFPAGADFRNDDEWWWLHLDCPWGSSHFRLIKGFAGPLPPWKKPAKWDHARDWIANLPSR
jgi:hypothetical protein